MRKQWIVCLHLPPPRICFFCKQPVQIKKEFIRSLFWFIVINMAKGTVTNGLSDPVFWCRPRQICERKGKRKKGGTDAIFRGARQGSRFTFTTESVCACLCSKGEIRGCFLSATGVGEPVEEDRSGWKIVQEELQPYAAADLGFLHASAYLTSPPYWIPSPRPGGQKLHVCEHEYGLHYESIDEYCKYECSQNSFWTCDTQNFSCRLLRIFVKWKLKHLF
ncbi:hypothetical protein GEV33_002061 [Tenebrio molitor]|uniref:Uncharacterized protein n=1 Tax=Tenebrio molitor TaxID=7067 RepID=A0A8J6LGC5_TENMO|nr:hypothetical protein GEV33_002061 [Tenebrio molitor]